MTDEDRSQTALSRLKAAAGVIAEPVLWLCAALGLLLAISPREFMTAPEASRPAASDPNGANGANWANWPPVGRVRIDVRPADRQFPNQPKLADLHRATVRLDILGGAASETDRDRHIWNFYGGGPMWSRPTAGLFLWRSTSSLAEWVERDDSTLFAGDAWTDADVAEYDRVTQRRLLHSIDVSLWCLLLAAALVSGVRRLRLRERVGDPPPPGLTARLLRPWYWTCVALGAAVLIPAATFDDLFEDLWIDVALARGPRETWHLRAFELAAVWSDESPSSAVDDSGWERNWWDPAGVFVRYRQGTVRRGGPLPRPASDSTFVLHISLWWLALPAAEAMLFTYARHLQRAAIARRTARRRSAPAPRA